MKTNFDELPEKKKEVIHRIKRDGTYLVLCDKNGEPIPRQISLKIESNYGEPVKVTMEAYVHTEEIHDGVLESFDYEVTEKIKHREKISRRVTKKINYE